MSDAHCNNNKVLVECAITHTQLEGRVLVLERICENKLNEIENLKALKNKMVGYIVAITSFATLISPVLQDKIGNILK